MISVISDNNFRLINLTEFEKYKDLEDIRNRFQLPISTRKLTISNSNKYLAFIDHSDNLHVYSLENNSKVTCLNNFPRELKIYTISLVKLYISPDDRYLILLSNFPYTKLIFLNLSDCKLFNVITIAKKKLEIQDLQFTPDNRSIVIGYFEKEKYLRLYKYSIAGKLVASYEDNNKFKHLFDNCLLISLYIKILSDRSLIVILDKGCFTFSNVIDIFRYKFSQSQEKFTIDSFDRLPAVVLKDSLQLSKNRRELAFRDAIARSNKVTVIDIESWNISNKIAYDLDFLYNPALGNNFMTLKAITDQFLIFRYNGMLYFYSRHRKILTTYRCKISNDQVDIWDQPSYNKYLKIFKLIPKIRLLQILKRKYPLALANDLIPIIIEFLLVDILTDSAKIKVLVKYLHGYTQIVDKKITKEMVYHEIEKILD